MPGSTGYRLVSEDMPGSTGYPLVSEAPPPALQCFCSKHQEATSPIPKMHTFKGNWYINILHFF